MSKPSKPDVTPKEVPELQAPKKIDHPTYLKGAIISLFSILITGAAFYMTFGYKMGKDIATIKATQDQLMVNLQNTQSELVDFRREFNNYNVKTVKENNNSYLELKEEINLANSKINRLEIISQTKKN